jgi:hypothetical protein
MYWILVNKGGGVIYEGIYKFPIKCQCSLVQISFWIHAIENTPSFYLSNRSGKKLAVGNSLRQLDTMDRKRSAATWGVRQSARAFARYLESSGVVSQCNKPLVSSCLGIPRLTCALLCSSRLTTARALSCSSEHARVGEGSHLAAFKRL